MDNDCSGYSSILGWNQLAFKALTGNDHILSIWRLTWMVWMEKKPHFSGEARVSDRSKKPFTVENVFSQTYLHENSLLASTGSLREGVSCRECAVACVSSVRPEQDLQTLLHEKHRATLLTVFQKAHFRCFPRSKKWRLYAEKPTWGTWEYELARAPWTRLQEIDPVQSAFVLGFMQLFRKQPDPSASLCLLRGASEGSHAPRRASPATCQPSYSPPTTVTLLLNSRELRVIHGHRRPLKKDVSTGYFVLISQPI